MLPYISDVNQSTTLLLQKCTKICKAVNARSSKFYKIVCISGMDESFELKLDDLAQGKNLQTYEYDMILGPGNRSVRPTKSGNSTKSSAATASEYLFDIPYFYDAPPIDDNPQIFEPIFPPMQQLVQQSLKEDEKSNLILRSPDKRRESNSFLHCSKAPPNNGHSENTFEPNIRSMQHSTIISTPIIGMEP